MRKTIVGLESGVKFLRTQNSEWPPSHSNNAAIQLFIGLITIDMKG